VSFDLLDELKALMPEDAREAIGYGGRAKRGQFS
jgi:hypothetical protein